LLSLAFSKSLYGLLQLALNTDLHSHIILVPVVCVYFAWIKKDALPAASNPRKALAIAPGLAAAAFLVYYWTAGNFEAAEDALALTTLAYALLIITAALFLYGPSILKKQHFSLWFLIFLVPMPLIVQDWVNTFFQYASAEVSYQMVKSVNIPIFRPHHEYFGGRAISSIEIEAMVACFFYNTPCSRSQWFPNIYDQLSLRTCWSSHDRPLDPSQRRSILFRPIADPILRTALLALEKRAKKEAFGCSQKLNID